MDGKLGEPGKNLAHFCNLHIVRLWKGGQVGRSLCKCLGQRTTLRMIDVAGHLLSQGAFSLAFSFDFFTFFLLFRGNQFGFCGSQFKPFPRTGLEQSC